MYSISQFAKSAGVSVETVRYYERRGLIEQPNKPSVGYRRYPEASLKLITFIKRSKELGFTLEEIANLLSLGDEHCDQVQELAKNKLTNVRCKINDLFRLESALDDLLNQCAANAGQAHCPIIESLLPENKKDR
ncbi:Hg(II)-responsive transcriptional regulator [Shewanella baltica]|uniref:Hg(II)-responsive transcriptional regulator n=1 Tax=Shewanella baltica TaxID=62322 RepID=UPI000E07202B|nr:Hg(II)-responsive transcriptional regulator [Shewanella baltica]SUI58868.1 Mercuric resistance operon regulatory protein [Shewanella baltica]